MSCYFRAFALVLLLTFAASCKSTSESALGGATVSSNSPTPHASVPSPGPSVQSLSRTEIESKVADIIVAQLGVDQREIKPGARLADDLGADELDHVELVMRLEEEFRIEISDADLEKLQTVRNIVDYVSYHLSRPVRTPSSAPPKR